MILNDSKALRAHFFEENGVFITFKKERKKLFYVLMLSTIYLNFLKFKLVYLIHTENKIHYKAKWDKPVYFNKPKTWWNISFSKRSLCKKCPLQFFWSNCAPMKVRESAESLGKRWVTGTALSHWESAESLGQRWVTKCVGYGLYFSYFIISKILKVYYFWQKLTKYPFCSWNVVDWWNIQELENLKHF